MNLIKLKKEILGAKKRVVWGKRNENFYIMGHYVFLKVEENKFKNEFGKFAIELLNIFGEWPGDEEEWIYDFKTKTKTTCKFMDIIDKDMEKERHPSFLLQTMYQSESDLRFLEIKNIGEIVCIDKDKLEIFLKEDSIIDCAGRYEPVFFTEKDMECAILPIRMKKEFKEKFINEMRKIENLFKKEDDNLTDPPYKGE